MNAIKGLLTPLETRLIAKLVGGLEQIEGVTAIILYGSRVGGLSDEDSDLDIAVITDRSLPHHKLDSIKDKIMKEMEILGELRVEVFGFTEKEMKHLPIGREIEERGVLLWKKDSSLQKAL
jgi:predicted nucleotidyltransferase